MHWQLRARANSQRHYEIYIVSAVDGITEDHIRDMFEANPQMAADTIRKLGTVFHSDRAEEDRVVIR
jgi:type VI protein secretion system component VasA